MPWINESGLPIRFGTELAATGKGGQFRWNGPMVEYEFDIIWNELEAFGTPTFLARTVRIPDGMLLTDATVEVTQSFTSGGSATIDIGFHNADGSAYDADGIDVSLSMANLTGVGTTIVCDGALVNTILANPAKKFSYVTATVKVANLTAGKAKLRLRLFVVDGGSRAPLNA